MKIILRFVAVAFACAILSINAFAQINGAPMPFVKAQFFSTSAGLPCGGCKLYSYAAGTTTPQATYSTSDLNPSNVNTNPIVLDSLGRPPVAIYMAAQNYKFVLVTANSATVWTQDNVYDIAQLMVAGLVPLVTTSISAKTINNVQMCDQYPGSTADAKIANCIAVLPSTGGIADAAGIQGNQSWVTCPLTGVTIGVTLMLPTGTTTVAANCTIPTNVTLQFSQDSVLSVNSGVTITFQGPITGSVTPGICIGSGTCAFDTSLALPFPVNVTGNFGDFTHSAGFTYFNTVGGAYTEQGSLWTAPTSTLYFHYYSGGLSGLTVVSGGTSWSVNDTFTVGGGTGGYGQVTSVSGGVVTGASVFLPGGGYTASSGVSTTAVSPSIGTGLTLNTTTTTGWIEEASWLLDGETEPGDSTGYRDLIGRLNGQNYFRFTRGGQLQIDYTSGRTGDLSNSLQVNGNGNFAGQINGQDGIGNIWANFGAAYTPGGALISEVGNSISGVTFSSASNNAFGVTDTNASDSSTWYFGPGTPSAHAFGFYDSQGGHGVLLITDGANATPYQVQAIGTGGLNVSNGDIFSLNGTNIVYRCATAGNLRAGALTITAADCGSTVDSGLRIP